MKAKSCQFLLKSNQTLIKPRYQVIKTQPCDLSNMQPMTAITRQQAVCVSGFF